MAKNPGQMGAGGEPSRPKNRPKKSAKKVGQKSSKKVGQKSRPKIVQNDQNYKKMAQIDQKDAYCWCFFFEKKGSSTSRYRSFEKNGKFVYTH